MTQHRNGRRFAVPASRRLSWDLLGFHHNMPLCSHDRRMNLQIVADARKACPLRISWPALFLKAYGLTAQEIPELRQTWYRWPWAHIYQHPTSVATLTVQRHIDGEPWLFWGNVRSPESLPLTELQESIDRFCKEDPAKIFAKQWRLAHLPTLLRRLIWWWNLNVETKKRATRVGTFFLSTLAGLGAEIQLPPSVQTGCLTYGPLDENGVARVTLAYDHRLMDGALVAGILDRLEKTLNQTIAAELKAIHIDAADHRAA
ncbi:MAG: hypothetical protein DWH78_05110 [Planctomycetota bacterium]|nr:MAG: hypothetical protein DWH78_05110 [Planctomycetota bacterium]